MKLQIRTLSVQERKELYTQALEYFIKPKGERLKMYCGLKSSGVCEYLSGLFYKPLVFKGMTTYDVDSMLLYAEGVPRIVDLGKELMPELWHRKTKEVFTEDQPFWFKSDEERCTALEQCIQDVSLLTEEDDEQPTKVLYEFIYNKD